MRKSVVVLASMAATLLLASGVALALTKVGSAGDNVLYGTNNPDKIAGRAGDDIIYGLGADDRCTLEGYLIGGQGNDTIYGGTGDDDIFGGRNFVADCDGDKQPGERGRDVLYAGSGSDYANGDAGADVLYGNGGSDLLFDGEEGGGAVDTLYGDSGDDYLFSGNNPAGKDIVYCGSGTDRVFADRKDVLYDCERVSRG
jgi:Ca2+-binding RTX toxin-like protein